MATRIAAIFAHPDDEILGCGATLAKHAAAGEEVRILILATGLAARAGETPDFERLRGQARAAAEVIGAAGIEFADFPDNRMDTIPLLDVVQRVESFIADAVPSLVYTHHAGDLNVDHRVVHQAVLTACRPLPDSPPREIRACEVLSSTEWAASGPPFLPSIFEPVGGTFQLKLDALECYEGEVRDWPHPRSARAVDALARSRGSQCGHEAAEAFQLVRRVAP